LPQFFLPDLFLGTESTLIFKHMQIAAIDRGLPSAKGSSGSVRPLETGSYRPRLCENVLEQILQPGLERNRVPTQISGPD